MSGTKNITISEQLLQIYNQSNDSRLSPYERYKILKKIEKTAFNEYSDINNYVDDNLISKLKTNYLNCIYEIEYQWAVNYLNKNNSESFIQTYPKYMHLEYRVDFEYDLFYEITNKKPKNICFIGSGPFPLSAIVLIKKYSCNVTLVDKDIKAIEMSKKVIKKAEFVKKTNFINEHIMNLSDFSGFDFIIVANMVGQTKQDKTKVLKHLIKYISTWIFTVNQNT